MSKIPYFEQYHQILFWPLEILDQSADGKSDDLKGWELVDQLEREASQDPQVPYQELVYFHPFAQQFLYPARGAKFTLHRRSDVGRVRVEFYQGSTEDLDVDRVHLYRFRQHQVAILVVEVSAKRRISREAVLLLEDTFRRIYPPYWDRKGTDLEPQWAAGHCPKSVEWLDKYGAPFLDENGQRDRDATSNYGARDATIATTLKDRLPPVCSHWKWLLRPLTGYAQIEDDRAPSMIFLIHENPPLISRGDLVRHCFYDGPGDEDDLPYSDSFLKDFEKDFAYTRFWNPSRDNWMKTSHTCCGYGFTVIAAAGGWGDVLLEHFRHHYFQIGLLAHFHRSTLLRFSNRFNKVMEGDEDEKHYDAMLAERKEFAKFISSSWFHEASNQDQGRELFELWSKRLRTEELMKNILTEADAVDAVLSAHEQRARDERLDRLTVLLYFAAAATFVVALLDSEVLRDLIRHVPPTKQGETPWFWKWNAFWAAIVSLALVFVYQAVMAVDKDKRKSRRRRVQFFWGLVAVLCAIALLALLMALGDR